MKTGIYALTYPQSDTELWIGSPSSSQWLRNGSCSSTQTTGRNTNNCNCYKQWTETWTSAASARSAFDATMTATVRGTVLGVASTTICIITTTGGHSSDGCSGYLENNQAATFSTTTTGAPSNEQWE